jgi:hypothetical protein
MNRRTKYWTHAEWLDEVDRSRGVTVEDCEWKKLVTAYHTTLARVGKVERGAERNLGAV